MHSDAYQSDVAAAGDAAADGVSESEARAELDRLLGDPEFACTDRNKRFLRFVADAALEGRERAIKAYSIAVDVFGRPSNFDPAVDPIVRIEAARLRAALSQYYSRPDNGERIRIELPKGHYVPLFRHSSGASSCNQADGEALTNAEDAPAERARASLLSRDWSIPAFAASAALLLAAAAWLNPMIEDDASIAIGEKPNLSIELEPAGEISAEAARFRDTLTIALSRFHTVQIDARAAPSRDIDATETGAVSNAPRTRYTLAMKYRGVGSRREVYWEIVDRGRGEVMQAGEEQIVASADVDSPANELATRLTAKLAAPQGIINQLQAQEELIHPTLGNGCTVRAFRALDIGTDDQLVAAQACLEQTLRLRPSDADAHAMLAITLLELDAAAKPTQLTARAVASAARAIALAPDSDRSQLAQMLAQFRIGHPEVSVAAGRRALELNPYNPMVQAELGAILFRLGRWEEGVALVLRAGRVEYLPQAAVASTLAFDAYRRGAFDEALSRLASSDRHHCYVQEVLMAATLAQLDRTHDAQRQLEHIRERWPDFEATFWKDMSARRVASSLVALVAAGLTKAGVAI